MKHNSTFAHMEKKRKDIRIINPPQPILDKLEKLADKERRSISKQGLLILEWFFNQK